MSEFDTEYLIEPNNLVEPEDLTDVIIPYKGSGFERFLGGLVIESDDETTDSAKYYNPRPSNITGGKAKHTKQPKQSKQSKPPKQSKHSEPSKHVEQNSSAVKPQPDQLQEPGNLDIKPQLPSSEEDEVAEETSSEDEYPINGDETSSSDESDSDTVIESPLLDNNKETTDLQNHADETESILIESTIREVNDPDTLTIETTKDIMHSELIDSPEQQNTESQPDNPNTESSFDTPDAKSPLDNQNQQDTQQRADNLELQADNLESHANDLEPQAQPTNLDDQTHPQADNLEPQSDLIDQGDRDATEDSTNSDTDEELKSDLIDNQNKPSDKTKKSKKKKKDDADGMNDADDANDANDTNDANGMNDADDTNDANGMNVVDAVNTVDNVMNIAGEVLGASEEVDWSKVLTDYFTDN